MAVAVPLALDFSRNNGHTFPDSPLVTDAFTSPELRGELSLTTAQPRRGPTATISDSRLSAEGILPLLHTVETTTGPEEERVARTRATLILRQALQWAIEHCDADLIGWLAGLTGEWAAALDAQAALLEDEDGWGLAGMAVQASCGRQDKEEVVRVVVGRWGMESGARRGRDRTGWTPLHLAALISTPPLVSFLLTLGACPTAPTNRGLTALDLVAGMPERQQVTVLLEQASNHGSSMSIRSFETPMPSLTEGRQKLLKRRRARVANDITKDERRQKQSKRDKERERWVGDKVEVVNVDTTLLFGEKGIRRVRVSQASGVESPSYRLRDNSDDEEGGDEADNADLGDWEELVFVPTNLPAIFDTIITTYQPVCQPLSRRGLPANTLHLYARFALRCDESWLEELLEGAVDCIEQGVHKRNEDLAYLAFWAYNTTLLLHLLVADEPLRLACDDQGLLGMVEELINAVHVFIIRVAERRIDTVLDGAILDHETLDDFEDVRFEGEWTLFRTLGTKKQRSSILPKASQVFSEAITAASNGIENGSPSGIFGSLRGKSPFKSQSLQPQTSVPNLRKAAADAAAMPPPSFIPSFAETPKPTDSPARVTDILTGVLIVLQLYDVNPIITVQSFSQIFFWIAAELFNRILTQRKYLCRSKAVQIRMNITVLDDWVRINGLPAKTATQHFEPVLQLLQWLQTQSSINSFDHLIGTTQGLKCLNPLQMRRAVKEYRFEVNEGRMNEECVAYMGQMQRDWENRRVQSSVKALQAGRVGSSIGSANSSPNPNGEVDQQGHLGTPIDALFNGSTNLADFVPSTGPECFGEKLDSRFMLPFQLPDNPAYLVATPPKDAVYANCIPASPFISDDMSRSGSRSSISLSRPFEYTLPPRRRLRELPAEFFMWLKDEEAKRRHVMDTKSTAVSPVSPAHASGGVLPHPLSITQLSEEPSAHPIPITSDGGTALGLSAASGRPSASLSRDGAATTHGESPFPSPGLKTSASMDQLRKQSQSGFQPIHPGPQPTSPKPQYRPESYELRIRRAANSLSSPPPSAHPSPRLGSPPMPSFAQLPTSGSTHSHRPISNIATQSYNSINNNDSAILENDSLSPLSPTESIGKRTSTFSHRSMSSSMHSDGSGSAKGSAKKKWWKIGRKEGSGDSNGSAHGR